MKILPRSFYDRNTRIIARELLGKFIVRKLGKRKLIGRIVETEAYLQNDPASHAYRGRTPRSAPMFEEPGRAYVYFIYGNHHCLNIVTEIHGVAGAVLIRALEPVEGIDIMRRHRGQVKRKRGKGKGKRGKGKGIIDLANGPGKLTQAFKIDRSFNRADLTRGELVVAKGSRGKFKIVRSKRIGLSKASDKLYRFYIKDNHFISRF